MNILKKIDIPGTSSKKSKPFAKAVEDLAAKDGSATLRIYEKSGLKGKYLGEIPIADGVEMARAFEEALKAEYGGGEYSVALCNRDAEVKAKYSFDIAGPAKGRRQSPDDESSRGRKSNSDRELLATVLGKLADAAITNKTSGNDEWQRTIELAQVLKGDGSDKTFEREIFSVLYNNSLSEKESSLENAMKIIELSQAISPKIEKEDTTTALINGIAPVLGQIVAARVGAQPRQEISQLQGNVQSLQGQTVLPRPGGAYGESIDPPGRPAEAVSGASSPGAPHTTVNPYHKMLDDIIEEIRKDLRGDADDTIIAQKLLGLIHFARAFTTDDPHPLLRGILASTDETANQEFFRFCSAIPELQRKPDRVKNIGINILRLIAAGAIETVERMERAEEEAGDTGAEEIGFEFETKQDQDADGEDHISQQNSAHETMSAEPDL